MKPDQIILSASGRYCRPQTYSEYKLATRGYLRRLQEISQIFSTLAVVQNGSIINISADLQNLDAIIDSQCNDPEKLHRYIDRAPDGRLWRESKCRIGFAVSYYSRHESGNTLVPLEDGGIELTVQGCSAGFEATAQLILKLPLSSHSELHTTATLKQILTLSLDAWDCRTARVRCRQHEAVVNRGIVTSTGGQWLLYLPLQQLSACLPSFIHVEPFGTGILIQTTAHIPDANSPADIAAGQQINDALDELGLLHDCEYAIEGWPPDPEEWRYEEFISGAPPGRKYCVHCIDFDGFDADRNVLLYAKLFRPLKRHPKPWGLRGWDGPVLNEAKRQVRAAAKAGGVAIEWHVGIEESAARVRELLADYTNITERQLKVIYTPLEHALQSSNV